MNVEDPNVDRAGAAAYSAAAAPPTDRSWLVLLHLSQFCGYFAPLAGFAAPILIWLLNNEDPEIDAHGRRVANWIISHLIYTVVSVILAFVAIGIPLLIGLGVLGVVLPIIGAVKASEGVAWRYPLSIRFF